MKKEKTLYEKRISWHEEGISYNGEVFEEVPLTNGDKILREIKNAEQEGGIEIDKIIMNLKDVSPIIIKQEIEKFISEGIVFEPSPGKVRYLG